MSEKTRMEIAQQIAYVINDQRYGDILPALALIVTKTLIAAAESEREATCELDDFSNAIEHMIEKHFDGENIDE